MTDKEKEHHYLVGESFAWLVEHADRVQFTAKHEGKGEIQSVLRFPKGAYLQSTQNILLIATDEKGKFDPEAFVWEVEFLRVMWNEGSARAK